MRNDNEHTRSPETVKVDHARRRLAARLLAGLAIIILTAWQLSKRYTQIASTVEGQDGLFWGGVIVLTIQLIFFLVYVLSAYTPFFKVMPKGEMGKLSNWGKSGKKKSPKTAS